MWCSLIGIRRASEAHTCALVGRTAAPEASTTKITSFPARLASFLMRRSSFSMLTLSPVGVDARRAHRHVAQDYSVSADWAGGSLTVFNWIADVVTSKTSVHKLAPCELAGVGLHATGDPIQARAAGP